MCICLNAQELYHWHPLNWKWELKHKRTTSTKHFSLMIFTHNVINWRHEREKNKNTTQNNTSNGKKCTTHAHFHHFHSRIDLMIRKVWVVFGVFLFCFYYFCLTSRRDSLFLTHCPLLYERVCLCVCVSDFLCVTRHAFHNACYLIAFVYINRNYFHLKQQAHIE